MAGHAEEKEAEVTSAIDKTLSMLDSAFPILLKVKEGRDSWRKTTSAAADAQKRFEATVDRLERIKGEAKNVALALLGRSASVDKGGGDVTFAVRKPELIQGDRRLERLPLLSLSRCQRCHGETIPRESYHVASLDNVVNGSYLFDNGL